MRCSLGIDLSTEAVTAILVAETGEILCRRTTGFPSDSPDSTWVEQNPRDWWSALVEAVQIVLAHPGARANLKSVGVCGQMHTLVSLDDKFEIIRPAIAWSDTRAEELTREFETTQTELFRRHGHSFHSSFTLAKLLWLRKHEPQSFYQIKHILLPKDFINWKLTGEHCTDPSDASGTLLYDTETRSWSESSISLAEIKHESIPPVVPSSDVIGKVSREAARATGIPEGTPVIAGCGDLAARVVGLGALASNQLALSIDDSTAAILPTQSYHKDEAGRLGTFCHAVQDQWYVLGTMLASGNCLRWYANTIAPGLDYRALVQEAENSLPGSKGIFFLPHLLGERSPHNEPYARGAFIGLTAAHTRADLSRALLEGIAFGIADTCRLVGTCGEIEISDIRACGQGASSSLWLQILADILDVPIMTTTSTEPTACGAALLAAVSAGIWSSLEEGAALVARRKVLVEPTPLKAFYQDAFAIYREIFPSLYDIFTAIGEKHYNFTR